MTRFVFKGNNSFNKIMKIAGFEVPKISRKYTDQDRFDNLLNVWTYYGRQPNYAEMKVFPSIVGPKAYVTRWGSWTKALNGFVDKVNRDIIDSDKEEIEIVAKKKIEKKKSLPEDKREIPIGLRYDILKRDSFRCVLCGAVPSIHNVTLEVDHIIPWTKEGKTKRENLRTLCNKCNKGKSDKLE